MAKASNKKVAKKKVAKKKVTTKCDCKETKHKYCPACGSYHG